MTSCHTCRHYQPALDPCGCFVGAGTTGFFGKLAVTLGGCPRYESEDELLRNYYTAKILEKR